MDEDVGTQVAPSKRIIELDIIRGIFLVVILIDHIELYPSGFDLFTGRGRLLVSAAEGFFFMSGLLVGMVYRRRINRGMKFIFRKMWRRAIELWLASIVLSLLFTAAAIYLHHTGIKDGLLPVTNWPHIIKETVLMRYGYGWADFLDRFAILMFLAPFAFWLLVKKKWWLLAIISLVTWAFRGNNFTFSWQLIFAGGMIIGYHWYQLGARYRKLSAQTKKHVRYTVGWVTGISFLLSYASVFILSVLNERMSSLPLWLQHGTNSWNSANAWVWLYSQKWTVGPVRIVLFAFWFSTLFWLVSRYYRRINPRLVGAVELLGRNSLFVYIIHAFIVFGFKLFIPSATTLLENFLITAVALLLLIIITRRYEKWQVSKQPKKAKAHAKQPKQAYLKPDLVKSP
ncbi:MAG TPA: OpgC domain-containing protein [Candidatus Binatia bacterium]|nr:OpgC domain-containing protein [Candidatus Binatia bacterium]